MITITVAIVVSEITITFQAETIPQLLSSSTDPIIWIGIAGSFLLTLSMQRMHRNCSEGKFCKKCRLATTKWITDNLRQKKNNVGSLSFYIFTNNRIQVLHSLSGFRNLKVFNFTIATISILLRSTRSFIFRS